MIGAWTSHLKDQTTKDNFEDQIRRSQEVLERLDALLKQELAQQEATELTVKAFDTPNWAERQAFYNGYRAALNTVTKIINIDPRRKSNDR